MQEMAKKFDSLGVDKVPDKMAVGSPTKRVVVVVVVVCCCCCCVVGSLAPRVTLVLLLVW